MPSAGLASRRVVQLSALFAMFALYTAQLVSALIPYVPVFVAASAAGLALDTYLQYKQPGLLSLLGKIRFDVTVRQLLRDMLILVGLLRIDGIEPLAEQSPLTIALLAFYALHFVCQAVAVLVRRTRALPIVTRNIDASELRLSAAPPRILARRQGHRLLGFAAPGTIGLLITAATTDALWGVIGLGVSIVLLGGGTVYLATWLLPKKRALSEQKVMAWLDRWLADYKPTVAMYFSGGTSSAYQANMWLSTLSEVDGKPLIVLRERFMVQKIDATDVPIICFPKVATMFSLENSTLKMVLHPANAAKTSQVLRIPTIKHAFINHGESDKLSSCNPYAKAYDEVWVAGPRPASATSSPTSASRTRTSWRWAARSCRPSSAPPARRRAPVAEPQMNASRRSSTPPRGRAGTATRATRRWFSPARTSSSTCSPMTPCASSTSRTR